MIQFFLALTGTLLLVIGIAVALSMAFGYFLFTVIRKTTGKKIGSPVTAFIIGLPIAYSFSVIQGKSQIAFLLALFAFAGLGLYAISRTGMHMPSQMLMFGKKTRKEKTTRKRSKRDIIELEEEETPAVPEPAQESPGPFAILDKINPLGNPIEKAAKEFVLTRFGEKGSVKRSWEKSGKHHVIVQTTSGLYSITLNPERIVVDWEKT